MSSSPYDLNRVANVGAFSKKSIQGGEPGGDVGCRGVEGEEEAVGGDAAAGGGGGNVGC